MVSFITLLCLLCFVFVLCSLVISGWMFIYLCSHVINSTQREDLCSIPSRSPSLPFLYASHRVIARRSNQALFVLIEVPSVQDIRHPVFFKDISLLLACHYCLFELFRVHLNMPSKPGLYQVSLEVYMLANGKVVSYERWHILKEMRLAKQML